MAAKRVFSISLDADLITRLDDLADARGTSRSALIETYIRDSIGEDETVVNVLTDPVLVAAFAKAFASRDVMARMAQAIGQESSPDQLQLFQTTLQTVADKFNAADRSRTAADSADPAVTKSLQAKPTKKKRAKKR